MIAFAEAAAGGTRWAVLADDVTPVPGWRVALDSAPWAVYVRAR